MSSFNWLRKLFPASAPKSVKRTKYPANRFLPIPEHLETRDVPAVIVTPASGGTDIPTADAADGPGGGQFTSLGDIVIAESGANKEFQQDQASTTLIFSPPTGWKFQPGAGTVGFTASRDITAASIDVQQSAITVTLSVGNGSPNQDTLTISGINVQADSGSFATSPAGNILRTGGTADIDGINTLNSTNFGSLSQLASVATRFAFTTSPIIVATGETSGTITVQLQDEFGNPVNAGAALTVNLSSSSTGATFRDNADTSNITFVEIASGTSTADFRYLDTEAGNPVITASFSGGGITDGTQVETVTISPPTITSLTPSTATVAEGDTSTLTLEFVDSAGGGLDTYSATIEWGDGATSVLGSVTSGQVVTHAYLADGPASYTASATVVETGGGTSAVATAQLGVSNVEPSVTSLAPAASTIGINGTASLSVTFTDPAGPNDTYTATIEWGDSTTSVVGVSSGQVVTHVYPAVSASYVISATVNDEDGGTSAVSTVDLTVTDVNSAPVIDASGNPSAGSYEQDATNPGGILVSDLIASSSPVDMIGDLDGDPEGIAVVGVNGMTESFTSFTDDFNRGALGDGYTTQVGAGFTLNGATASTTGFSMVVLDDVVQANLAVEADVAVGASGSFVGLVARYNGVGDNNLYLATLANVSGVVTADIWKNVAGAYTKLVTSAPLGTTAGTLRMEILGSNLQVFFNGVLRGEVTDTSLAGAGRIGLRAQGGTYDNLLVESVAGSTIDIDDNFDRAALGGAYATQVGAGFNIVGGVATSNGFSLVTNVNSVHTTDVIVEANVSLNGSGSFAGLVARYSGPGDSNLYLGTLANNGTNNVAQIWKNVGGTYTLLASTVVASGAGLLRFEVVGTSLRLFVDDVLRASAFDASITGGGSVGLRGSNGTTFDNLAISTPPLGTWQFSTDDGGSWADLGAVSDSSARLLASDADTRVRFLPNPGAASSAVLPSLLFRAWDQTTGTNGDLADASTNGGTTAFSSGTEFATASVFVADNFTAAFETGWTTQVAGATVTGNQVVSTTGLAVSTYNGLAAADVSVQADATAPNAGNFVGVLGRYQGSGDTNTYAAFLVNVGGQGFAEIWKNVGGTWTKLTSAATATAGTLRLEIFATTLKLFFNGALVGTAQDSSIAAAGVTGIRLGSGGPTIDSFAATQLETPSAVEYADDFDRANSASLGSNYNEINDGATIVGNQVQLNAFSLVAVKNQFLRDVSAEVDVTLTPDASNVAYAGLAVRHAGAGDSNMYWAGLVQTSPTNFSVQLWKAAPNFTSPMATVALASGTGRLRVEALGSSLKVYVDDVLRISVNDTSLSGAGFISLRGFKANLDNLGIDAL